MRFPRRIAFLLCASLVFPSCASMEEKVLAASPADDSGFLENADKMAPHPERAPFNRVWWAPDFDWKKYSKMYVSTVDTHHLLQMSIWEQINVRAIDVKRDIADMAVEFRGDLENAFRNDPKHHFEILDDPAKIDDKTVVIQVALVELVPNKAALATLGTAAWAAPLAIGVPVGTLAAFTDQGSISFEGRARDGGTGDVVAMCADREVGPMRVVDFRTMTWYGNAHEVLEQWSQQLVELSNTPRDAQVKHAAYFTLMPW